MQKFILVSPAPGQQDTECLDWSVGDDCIQGLQVPAWRNLSGWAGEGGLSITGGVKYKQSNYQMFIIYGFKGNLASF